MDDRKGTLSNIASRIANARPTHPTPAPATPTPGTKVAFNAMGMRIRDDGKIVAYDGKVCRS